MKSDSTQPRQQLVNRQQQQAQMHYGTKKKKQKVVTTNNSRLHTKAENGGTKQIFAPTHTKKRLLYRLRQTTACHAPKPRNRTQYGKNTPLYQALRTCPRVLLSPRTQNLTTTSQTQLITKTGAKADR